MADPAKITGIDFTVGSNTLNGIHSPDVVGKSEYCTGDFVREDGFKGGECDSPEAMVDAKSCVSKSGAKGEACEWVKKEDLLSGSLKKLYDKLINSKVFEYFRGMGWSFGASSVSAAE